MKILENTTLAPLTYYKIGGPARYLAYPESLDDLREIRELLCSKKLGYFILGAGSNVLLDDEGFDGLVISTSKLAPKLELQGSLIEASASTMVIQLLRLCMREGIRGFELLVGIPGNMGGVFFMNAGTKLGEICERLESLSLFDLATGQTRVVAKAQMKYSYRSQNFLNPHELIVSGVLRGKKAEPEAVQKKIDELLRDRKKSQPIDKPSCGSVFKNPDPAKGLNAWKLIADAGLRGQRVGNAQISELHTNFIINLGGAKASDVRTLIALAKEKVREKTGIELHEEVQVIAKTPLRFL